MTCLASLMARTISSGAHSPRFDRFLFGIEDVPDRDYIRIHPANYQYECEGCIFPATRIGRYPWGVKRQGYYGLDSRRATEKLHSMLPKDVMHRIVVRNVPLYLGQ